VNCDCYYWQDILHSYCDTLIEQIALNKSNLLLEIILQNTQRLQLITEIIKT
jgi:hypothetical protein